MTGDRGFIWTPRQRPLVLLGAAALAVALLATACGGGTSGGNDAAPSDSVDGPTFDDDSLRDTIVASQGGDDVGATLAVLIALDRGYAFDTIADNPDALTADGVIVSSDGEILEPAGTDLGIIVDKPPLRVDEEAAPADGATGVSRIVAMQEQPATVTTEELRTSLEADFPALTSLLTSEPASTQSTITSAAATVTTRPPLTSAETRLRLITGLARSGYSAEQILLEVIAPEPERYSFGAGGDVIWVRDDPPETPSEAYVGWKAEYDALNSTSTTVPVEATTSWVGEVIYEDEGGFSIGAGGERIPIYTNFVDVGRILIEYEPDGDPTSDYFMSADLTFRNVFDDCTWTFTRTFRGIGGWNGELAMLFEGEQVLAEESTCALAEPETETERVTVVLSRVPQDAPDLRGVILRGDGVIPVLDQPE